MPVNAQRAAFWFFSFFVAIAALAPGRAAADDERRGWRPFDRLVIFGDSLSDPGNAYLLTGGRTVAPPDYGMTGTELVSLIPEFAYASHRFSNGVTWVELLAAAVGRTSDARPAVPGALYGEDDGRASNYAVAGATAAYLPDISQFSLDVQVRLFLRDVRYRAPADALYVMAFGGNDLRAASTNPQALGLAVESIARNVRQLHQAGARKFLVWNAPDLGATPALRRLDAFACGNSAGCLRAPATAASVGYNLMLAATLEGLRGLPGIEIVPFDVFGHLAAIQAHPRRYGLKDATSACIRPNTPPLHRCADPDRHLFWDGIHPTRAAHAIIALLVGKALLHGLLVDD